VINFHGGGFTLGTATDDARWCGTVVDECDAVVVSVEYRKAPEMPFPTAVEDGVDAVLWIHEHADELGIDREKIALSGFSSGGNMAFTVPLRLYDEQTGFQRDDASRPNSRQRAERALHGAASAVASASSSTTSVDRNNHTSSSSNSNPPNNVEVLRPEDPSPPILARLSEPTPPTPAHIKEARTTVVERDIPDVKIRCIIPWYPSLDYTRTREERRATCVRKDQELPALFTDLFDESYLHPPDTISLDSPYLSPGVAPTELLKEALPEHIIMHTCEYDMLLDEGQEFHHRLTSPPLNKRVVYRMVEGVPHGWDKAPNPWKPTPGVREHYLRACREMRRVFGTMPGVREHPTAEGVPSAAPRGSVQVVR
jgi:putative ergosteryl-3beta-O-L-aspartate hydrolase